MGSKLTSTGVTFGSNLVEQTKPVVSVNGIEPDDTGKITVPTPQSFIDRVEALETSLETSDVYAICHAGTDHTIIKTYYDGTTIEAFDKNIGSSDGFYVGTNYAIFYYAGAYTIKLVSNHCDEIPIKITMLSGGGGGAGGYQGQAKEGSMHSATNNGEDGHNSTDAHSVVYSEINTDPMNQTQSETVNKSELREYVPDSSHGITKRIDTLYGWSGAERQGVVPVSNGEWNATPPYNVNTNVYKRKQEATVLTGRVMNKSVEYLVYVGSGGDGGHGAGGNADWEYSGGVGGDGGSGGFRGQGADGSNGAGDGVGDSYVAIGGDGGVGGGKSGASHVFSETGSPLATVDIDIFETQRNKSFDGFGQVGSTGATGDATAIHDRGAKDTGGGGGGGGGSNGIVLIEWGDF